MEKWPNFFIVGAAKAGTSSLYAYLKNTEGVYMSPLKETNYFSPTFAHLVNMSRVKNKDDYLKLFRGVTDEKAIGEVSPVYLRDARSPDLIKKTIPNAKIIICLRNPVQRAFSHYLMHLRGGYATRTFSEAFQNFINSKEKDDRFQQTIINPGFYFEITKRYVQLFGQSQVKIIIFEEFVKNQKEFFREILRFLDVDSEIPKNIGKVYNQYLETRNKLTRSIIRNKIIRKIAKNTLKQKTSYSIINKILSKEGKKPELTSEEKTKLWKIYQSDIIKLEEFLNRSLPWVAT